MKRLASWGPYAALAFTCVLGWIFKAHCGAVWTGSIQYVTGCYSDAVTFWSMRGVADGQIPYLESRIEYPVLTGVIIWIAGALTHLFGGADADALDFLTVTTGINAILAFAILAILRAMGVSRIRQYAWGCAPVIVLYLGHNWDMAAVALAMGSLLAASRARRTDATALAALGVSAKLFPIVILPVFGLSALLERDRLPRSRLLSAAGLVVLAVATWGMVNLPVAVAAFENWSEFYRFSSARGGTAAATWDVLNDIGVWKSTIAQRNAASAIAFIIGGAVILALGWRRSTGREWMLATPLVAWFLLTSKVWSPQFDLWLYPMLLATCARPLAIAAFALADVLAYFAEFLMFATMEGALDGWASHQGDVDAAAILRAGVVLWIIFETVKGGDPKGMREVRTS